MAKSKSYWSGVSCDSDRDRKALLSWFSPLCDDMTPIKAEILCDLETDREKKLRVLMRRPTGEEQWAIRSRTKSGHTITLKRTGAQP